MAEPYRKIKPEPFCIANSLKSASYVSLQSALAWYGLIPEFADVRPFIERQEQLKMLTKQNLIKLLEASS